MERSLELKDKSENSELTDNELSSAVGGAAFKPMDILRDKNTTVMAGAYYLLFG